MQRSPYYTQQRRVPYGGWWPPGGCNSRSTAASSASDTEDASAASDEVVYAFSKSRAGETPHQPPSWPQSQSNRKRGSTSPTLPDEELTSMLQSYLDDTAKKYSSNSKASSEEAKMDLEYLNQQDYYYPNQTFLPNVSPSASSLDSGYCGPASVQSSVESPHNLGYPHSPWQPQQTDYYMHSTSSPPPNYMNHQPNGSSSYHNGSYPLEAGGHSSTTIKSNYNSDQDISQIVDHVLSCIDTSHFDLDYNHHQEHNQSNQPQENATLLLCHNCGARLRHTVQHCKQCGEEMSGDQTSEQQSSDLKSNSSSPHPESSPKHKRKRQKQEAEEESQYWTSNSTSTEVLNEKKIGIVEPRIVIKPQNVVVQSPEARVTTQNNIGLKATCSDFKINTTRETTDFPIESSSESSQSSSEDEIEIKASEVAKKRKKKRRSKKNSSRLSLRRKAEALLRLAAQTDNKDECCSKGNNSSGNNPTVTNFSLKTPDDQWLYCEVRGCSFWTRKAERMDRHRQCHRPDAKYYKCPDCSLRFYSLAKMLKHDRKVHTGVKDYECRVCEAEVTDIQIHMRVHKAEKQFECPVCPMTFRHKNSLVRHLCQHTGERPYRCQNCDSAFISMHRLKDHLRKQHPHLTNSQLPNLNSSPKPISKPIKTTNQNQISKPNLTPHPTKSPVLMTTTSPQFLPILSLVQGPTGQIYLLNTGHTGNQLNYVLASENQPTNLVLSPHPQIAMTASASTSPAEKSNIRVSGKLDIDLTKSQKQQQEKKTSSDIVASALVTSRVLKSC